MKIKWNRKGFYDLRREPGVVADLEDRAARIATAANDSYGGDGYETSSIQGKRKPQGRWRTTVMTYGYMAQMDQARNNTLLRNLDEGR